MEKGEQRELNISKEVIADEIEVESEQESDKEEAKNENKTEKDVVVSGNIGVHFIDVGQGEIKQGKTVCSSVYSRMNE